MRKGSIDMVTFVVGFGLMIILIIVGSYFLIDDEVSTDLQAEITHGGTSVQTFFAANTIFKSEEIDLQNQLARYRDPGVNSDVVAGEVNSGVEDFLNSSYERYEFRVDDTEIDVEENHPTSIFRFYVSSPSGEERASLMVDNQEGEPYEPVVGDFGG